MVTAGTLIFQEGPDGENHIFAIPDLIPYGKTVLTRPDNGWYIQSAVLEEAGWPQVETFAQYWKLIEDYKANHPTIDGEETIGFEILAFDWYQWYVFEAAHQAMIGTLDSAYKVDKVNGKWTAKEFYFDEHVKRYFSVLNEMYRKGLINPEGFVNNLDQYKASLTSGRVLATYQPEWVIGDVTSYLKFEMPEKTLVALPLKWEEGDFSAYNEIRSSAVGMGTSISINCEDPVSAIKYLDTLITEEVQMLGYWGIEGVDYYRDSNGRVNRTEDQNDNFADRSNDYFYPQWGGEYYNEFWPGIDGSFSDGTTTRYGSQPEIFFQSLTEREQQILTEMNWETFSSAFNPPSSLSG